MERGRARQHALSDIRFEVNKYLETRQAAEAPKPTTCGSFLARRAAALSMIQAMC